MKKGRILMAVVLFLAAAWIVPGNGMADEDAPRIGKAEVKALLNDPSVTVLDARLDADWQASDRKIKGAVRVDPLDIGAWAKDYPKHRKLIVYCA